VCAHVLWRPGEFHDLLEAGKVTIVGSDYDAGDRIWVARFSGRGLRIHDGKQPVATFPAAHPEVGDLLIDDDVDELTISVGSLTHGHFSPNNYQEPLERREEEVINRVAIIRRNLRAKRNYCRRIRSPEYRGNACTRKCDGKARCSARVVTTPVACKRESLATRRRV
jgi:hypothetical protein